MSNRYSNTLPELTHQRRDNYYRALTELVGVLGLHRPTAIHAGSFCEGHYLTPAFLDALCELEALQWDTSQPCTKGILYFQKTAILYKITPETVHQQIHARVRLCLPD